MAQSKMPIARELMERVRSTLSPETSLLEAIALLAEGHMSAVPVVDENQSLLGLLTEKDCLRILSVSVFHRPQDGRVSDYLSALARNVEADMDLFRIAELFLENNFPMLPVVDGGKLVGCITRQHVLHGIIEFSRATDEEDDVKVEDIASEAVSRPRSIADMQKAFASLSRDQLVRRLGRRS